MSQLIALIIAIALGAIVTAIGYVFLGDAFTDNSLKGQVQQIINQQNQIEVALTAYKAVNGISAHTVMLNNAGGYPDTSLFYDDTLQILIDENYLKDAPNKLIETGTYLMNTYVNGSFSKVITEIYDVPEDVCNEINRLAGLDAETPSEFQIITYNGTRRFHCYNDSMMGTLVFEYMF